MTCRLDEVPEAAKLYSSSQWRDGDSLVPVQLAKLKDETRCPICYGKIRNARVSMACLHRYCAACIEQYLRAKVPGRSNSDARECPVCRAHLHSRRATKPDPTFDRIIQGLYGNVDKFDAEEDALVEQDNKARSIVWQEQMTKMREAAAQHAANAPPLARIKPSADQLRGGSTVGRGRGRGRGGRSSTGGTGSGGGRGKRPREPDSMDAAAFADADLLLSLAPNGKKRKVVHERSLSAIMADAPSVGPGKAKGGRGAGVASAAAGAAAGAAKKAVKSKSPAAKYRARPGMSLNDMAREEAQELLAEAAAAAAAAQRHPHKYCVQLWHKSSSSAAGGVNTSTHNASANGQPQQHAPGEFAQQEAGAHADWTPKSSAEQVQLLPPYLTCPGMVTIGTLRQLLQQRADAQQQASPLVQGTSATDTANADAAASSADAVGGEVVNISKGNGSKHVLLFLADAAHAARHAGGAGVDGDGNPVPLADATTISALWSSLPEPLADVVLHYHVG